MMQSPQELQAVQNAAALERPLKAVEDQLAALGLALHQQDAEAVDVAAAELHRALAHAVDHFGRAARSGGVPHPLRMRLAQASGQVAAQREALARATASLDRAIDVLIPRMAPASLYSAAGSNDRQSRPGGGLLA
jgi:ABC-type transporter Mla subunit MlaD